MNLIPTDASDRPQSTYKLEGTPIIPTNNSFIQQATIKNDKLIFNHNKFGSSIT